MGFDVSAQIINFREEKGKRYKRDHDLPDSWRGLRSDGEMTEFKWDDVQCGYVYETFTCSGEATIRGYFIE